MWKVATILRSTAWGNKNAELKGISREMADRISVFFKWLFPYTIIKQLKL